MKVSSDSGALSSLKRHSSKVTSEVGEKKQGSFQSGKGSIGAVTCETGRRPGTEQVLNTSLLQKRTPLHTAQNSQFYLAESWDIRMVRST